ncbi:hypothetical protein [Geobacter benzoatilyticus]|uniref:Uncharacterized protein n=1 Tax=Geobacter benzoatilyticus TaxID=2815309 RepID=A0ABX7Q323_9BACT|nr:hypothetical protein [Geobacter benzoatilyticus]QSV45301.1 hypothetical protein JZM60_14405 [Geobacter benzoatilyticus]
MFFGEENNAQVLGKFLRKAEAAHVEDAVRAKRLSISKEIISYIYKSPEGWDDRCTFNIKHIGNQFIQWLRDFDSSKNDHIDHIYCIVYRFLCEFDFLVGPGKELSMELRRIKDQIQSDEGEMDGDVRSQIIYASYVMPANIAKEFINDSNIASFREFEAKKSEAAALKKQWDEEIEVKKDEADAIKDKLNEYKIGFNFIGLYKGFEDLGSKKNTEVTNLFRSLILMGIVIVLPLLIEIIVAFNGIYQSKSLGIDHLFVVIPLLSTEIILIYYFRVILHNLNSAKAQKMQIELRQTLCQFIQSYAEFSEKIKKQDKTALEKFENLIFSGILADPEKLPSTYDGIDQIGKLVKSLKGP